MTEARLGTGWNALVGHWIMLTRHSDQEPAPVA